MSWQIMCKKHGRGASQSMRNITYGPASFSLSFSLGPSRMLVHSTSIFFLQRGGLFFCLLSFEKKTSVFNVLFFTLLLCGVVCRTCRICRVFVFFLGPT